MKISNSSLVSLVFNFSCAIGNAYQAPGTFALSFAIGMILGMGMGLKHRLNLVKLEINEAAIQKIDEKTKHVQELLPSFRQKVFESRVGNFAQRVSKYIQPIFRGLLYLTGYHALFDSATSYLGRFDEQRACLIKKLNPIPGKLLSLISFGALIANFGFVQNAWMDKVTLLSGFPLGYAAGTLLMRNFDWGLLNP